MQKARGHGTRPLPPLVGTRFQVLFHSPSGVLFTFPSRYWSAIGHQGVLSLAGWSPQIQTAFHGSGPTQELDRQVSAPSSTGRLPSVVGGSTPLRLPPDLVTAAGSDTIRSRVLRPPACNACPLTRAGFRLIPFRSPLLGESRLISFPRGTEMFQFPSLPSIAYVFSDERRRITGAGLPHSEIRGSKPVQRLTAAYRSRPRPSSAAGAKASTVCPYYLDGELPPAPEGGMA